MRIAWILMKKSVKSAAFLRRLPILCDRYTKDEPSTCRSGFNQQQNQARFCKIYSPPYWTFAALLDPFLDILHGRQLLFQFLRQLACHLIGADADGLAHILQRVFRNQIIFALAEQQPD